MIKMKFKDILRKLTEKKNLTKEETEHAMLEIMEGKLSDAEIAEFLVALKEKGESIEEITACAKIMREKSVKIKVENCIDMCGTGGDKSNTFNISTAASFIV